MALAVAPSLAMGPAPALALFQLVAARAPSPSPRPLRGPRLTSASNTWLRGSSARAPSSGLFPYLGGKRNRETGSVPEAGVWARLPASRSSPREGDGAGWAPQELRRPGWD